LRRVKMDGNCPTTRKENNAKTRLKVVRSQDATSTSVGLAGTRGTINTDLRKLINTIHLLATLDRRLGCETLPFWGEPLHWRARRLPPSEEEG